MGRESAVRKRERTLREATLVREVREVVRAICFSGSCCSWSRTRASSMSVAVTALANEESMMLIDLYLGTDQAWDWDLVVSR